MRSLMAFKGMTDPFHLPTTTLFIHNATSLVILVCHIYQWFQHLPYEVEHIWCHPKRTTKCCYLLGRYGGILAQAANFIFFSAISASSTVARAKCADLHFFQLFAGRGLLLLVEITLVDRVIVMYKDETWVAAFLIGLLTICAGGGMAAGSISIIQAKVSGACLTHNAPIIVTFLAVGAILTHLIIWIFMWRKRQYQKSILTVIIRDGRKGIMAIIVILVFVILNNLFSNYSHPVERITHFIYQVSFPLFIASLTWLNCYLIENLSRKRIEDPCAHPRRRHNDPVSSSSSSGSYEAFDIEFTTFNTFTNDITISIDTTTSESSSTSTGANHEANSDAGFANEDDSHGASASAEGPGPAGAGVEEGGLGQYGTSAEPDSATVCRDAGLLAAAAAATVVVDEERRIMGVPRDLHAVVEQ